MCEFIKMVGIEASFPLLDNEWYAAIGGVFSFIECLFHFLIFNNEWSDSLYFMLSFMTGISWRHIKDLSLWGGQ